MYLLRTWIGNGKRDGEISLIYSFHNKFTSLISLNILHYLKIQVKMPNRQPKIDLRSECDLC